MDYWREYCPISDLSFRSQKPYEALLYGGVKNFLIPSLDLYKMPSFGEVDKLSTFNLNKTEKKDLCNMVNQLSEEPRLSKGLKKFFSRLLERDSREISWNFSSSPKAHKVELIIEQWNPLKNSLKPPILDE